VDPLGITIGILISCILIAIALYFAWRQRTTLAILRYHVSMPSDQRRYLLKQCYRRLFNSVLLLVLAGMMFGSLFLDFEPMRAEAPIDRDAASKHSLRILSAYFITMLLLLMVILTLAILDFWATARFSLQQQKQLLAEHQAMLQADLWDYQRRRAEMN
jgi:hypothetical protein